MSVYNIPNTNIYLAQVSASYTNNSNGNVYYTNVEVAENVPPPAVSISFPTSGDRSATFTISTSGNAYIRIGSDQLRRGETVSYGGAFMYIGAN